MERKVKLYALSTCAWCRKTRRFFEERNIPYEGIDVDLLEGEEKTEIRSQVAKHNPRISYPTIVVDDEIAIVGFDEDRLKEVFADDQQQG